MDTSRDTVVSGLLGDAKPRWQSVPLMPLGASSGLLGDPFCWGVAWHSEVLGQSGDVSGDHPHLITERKSK